MELKVDWGKDLEKIAKAFIQDAVKADEIVKKALKQGAEKVQADAQAKAPVDTGELKAGIVVKDASKKNKPAYHVIAKAKYAIFQEKGTGMFAEDGNGRRTPWVYKAKNGQWRTTRGNKPQPFMRPAFYANEKRIKELVLAAIRRELK